MIGIRCRLDFADTEYLINIDGSNEGQSTVNRYYDQGAKEHDKEGGKAAREPNRQEVHDKQYKGIADGANQSDFALCKSLSFIARNCIKAKVIE